MYLRVGFLSGWALVALLLGTLAVATFALARPAAAAAQAAPAPTLIWVEPDWAPATAVRYVRGLTKNGTEVSVSLDGRAFGKVVVRRGPAGTASFAVALPGNLEVGVHTVVATARPLHSRAAWSGPSLPLQLVVEGTVTVEGYLSCAPRPARLTA